MGGALSEAGLYAVVAEAGLSEGHIRERFDCFAGTSAGEGVADHMGLCGVNFFARK